MLCVLWDIFDWTHVSFHSVQSQDVTGPLNPYQMGPDIIPYSSQHHDVRNNTVSLQNTGRIDPLSLTTLSAPNYYLSWWKSLWFSPYHYKLSNFSTGVNGSLWWTSITDYVSCQKSIKKDKSFVVLDGKYNKPQWSGLSWLTEALMKMCGYWFHHHHTVTSGCLPCWAIVPYNHLASC